MDLARARYVVSTEGLDALEALDPALAELPPARLADRLRKTHAPFAASALAEQLTLRARARDRFGDDRGLAYSPDGLEMMTHPLVAARRAARLAALGLPVFDLTCGIGGDLWACLDAGVAAAGIDRDAVVALLAARNCYGMAARGSASAAPFDLSRGAVIVDPARRTAAGRRFDPNAFEPSWDTALGLLVAARAGVLKAPPGIDHAVVPAVAEFEVVQLGRSLREATVWIGGDAQPGLRRAVRLPAGDVLTSADPEAPLETRPPGAYLLDPEPCVTRAGLVRQLAARTSGRQLDPQVAYLAADEPVDDPLAATFRVREVLPFSVPNLRRYLRANGLVADEIRRRAFAVEPDELRRLLGKLEGERVALICTTIGRKRMVFVGERWRKGETAQGCRQ